MEWRENPPDPSGRALTRFSRAVLMALVAVTLPCAVVALWVDPLAWALVGALGLMIGMWAMAVRS